MSEGGRDNADNPGVIAPPPLIYAGALAAGLLANRRYRIPFLPRRIARTLGAPLLMGGLAIGLLGDREMRRAETNADPYKPATSRRYRGVLTGSPAILCTSEFMVLMYVGIAALTNALAPILLLPASPAA